MADVQIQTPNSGSGSNSGPVWAVVVVILLGVIAWFVFGGGLNTTNTTKVEVKAPAAAPAAPAPAAAPATTPGGDTKSP